MCPSAEHGQYTGRSNEPSIALEVASDDNLYIWHWYFGEPGGLNDINVWDRSPLLHAMTHGETQALDFDFQVNGQTFNMFYWLVDSIYPPVARFLSPFQAPGVHGLARGSQESHREDIWRIGEEIPFHYESNSAVLC